MNNFETENPIGLDRDALINDLYAELHHEDHDLIYSLKMRYQFFRKKFQKFFNKKSSNRFTNIVYLTTDCPNYTPISERPDSPLYYIDELRKQNPNYDVQLVVPLYGLDSDTKATRKIFYEIDGLHKVLEKTSIHFDYFAKNQEYQAVLYKFLNDDSNIKIYGIFSPAFSYINSPTEIEKFENLIPFIRAARISIRKINKELFPVDIVHCEKIPFFMGAELETGLNFKPKVLQITDDFAAQDSQKTEPFWAAINLADKKAMKKICKDSYIKNCIAELFNLHPANFSAKMRDCLDILYKNYTSFKIYANSKGKNLGEIIFDNLNKRILKMYPQMVSKGEVYYYPALYTVKKADFIAVTSKTYYQAMFSDSKMPASISETLSNRKESISYLELGLDCSQYSTRKGRIVYNNYDSENFRNERKENKNLLLKEFAEERLRTNFIDGTLFKNETDGNIQNTVIGYLDNFYNAPLLFAHLKPDVFGNGIDILFGAILKMFQINRNIQVIICIPDGLKNEFVKSRIDFLKDYAAFGGRWVYINEEINLPKFLAGADMFLMPLREDFLTFEHLLSMHFGCVPIVSKTGKLNDKVVDVLDDIFECNGFKTKDTLWNDDSTEQYYNTLSKGLEMYGNNPSGWNVIIKHAINYDTGYSFDMLDRYNSVYQEIL